MELGPYLADGADESAPGAFAMEKALAQAPASARPRRLRHGATAGSAPLCQSPCPSRPLPLSHRKPPLVFGHLGPAMPRQSDFCHQQGAQQSRSILTDSAFGQVHQ